MSAKYFLLYGNKTITAYIVVDGELVNWARRDNVDAVPDLDAPMIEKVALADRVLSGQYKTWAVFDYTPEGMAEFLAAAADAGEMVGLSALELGEIYIQEAQLQLNCAFALAQQKVIERVQFPIAGNTKAFSNYIDTLTTIREQSIKGLYEYVENGDRTPD